MNIVLRYPSLRSYLIDDLDSLKNKENQLKEWVNPNYHHAFWCNAQQSFDSIDNLCFDRVLDGRYSKNFQEGITLFDEEETDAVMKVVLAIKKVYDEIDMQQPDEAYINSPLWDDVVLASQEAYDLIIKNNKKYGLDLKEFWAFDKIEDERRQELEKKISYLKIPLSHPKTRRDILKALEGLQGLPIQSDENAPKHYPYVWNSIDNIRNFICEDSMLGFDNSKKENKPEFYKGYCLFDSQEADALIKVAQSLEDVYQKIGDGGSDSSYTASSLWHYVVSSSTKAYNLLVNNNKKYGLDFEELMIPLGKID